MADTDRLLLRVEEAAELLGLSRAYVYELLGTGAIPSVKIGRSRRIRPADLDAFVAGLRTEYL